MSVVNKRVTAPRLTYQAEASYTDAALQASVQGVVRIRVQIGPDGLVYRPEVIEGLGFGLDEQAVAAVQQWQFEPATWGGMPTAVAGVVEVAFQPPPQPAAPAPAPTPPATPEPTPAVPEAPPTGAPVALTAGELRRGIRFCESCNRKVKASPLGHCPVCGSKLARKARV